MSTAPSSNKYFIKSLEEEISLFDRKLAHLHKFESFPSDAERDAAAAKLSAKRDRLIRTVRDLIEGVPEPRPAKSTQRTIKSKASIRLKPPSKHAPSKVPATVPAPIAQMPEEMVQPPTGVSGPPRIASPYAGTSLDSDKELADYMQNRGGNRHTA